MTFQEACQLWRSEGLRLHSVREADAFVMFRRSDPEALIVPDAEVCLISRVGDSSQWKLTCSGPGQTQYERQTSLEGVVELVSKINRALSADSSLGVQDVFREASARFETNPRNTRATSR